MSSSSALPSFGSPASPLQATGMLSREQLIHLFSRFSFLTSQPDVKKRISDGVKDKQEAVAITTAIQEEILLEMGIDPRFGIACLGKVNMVYENDRDLMVRFYGFVAKEEVACDEAELEPDEFAEKLQIQQKMQEEQLEMLKNMRKFHPDDQAAILEMLHQQMENADFDSSTAVLTPEQIQEVRKRMTSSGRAIRELCNLIFGLEHKRDLLPNQANWTCPNFCIGNQSKLSKWTVWVKLVQAHWK